jgi:hypothetical protein
MVGPHGPAVLFSVSITHHKEMDMATFPSTPVEEQLDIMTDLLTWFGTAVDITVQEFADEYNRQERELALEEPLDFGDYDDMGSVYDAIPEDSRHYWC